MALIDKASLLMVPSVYEDGTLYNVLPSGNKAPDETGNANGYDQTRADFSFTRGANLAATRVNADGLIEKGRENLYTQSNNFSHSDWTPKAGTFTQGIADPDGGNNAWAWEAANTDPYLYQNKNLSGVHCLSIWAKGSGNTIGHNIEVRVGASITFFELTSEWQRFEAFAVLSGSVNIGFEYGNPSATAGDVIHIYQAQLEVGTIATAYMDSGATTATAGVLENTPRIDYSSGAGALLLEPQRTNGVADSEYIGGWNSIQSGITLTANYGISPEGVRNSTRIQFSGASLELRDTTSVAAGNMSSIYVKGTNGETIKFGSNGAEELFTLNGEWQRIEKYNAAAATKITINTYSGATARDIEVYGAMQEAGSYVSSYVPTYGSAATRGADSCSVTGASNVIGQTEGTLYAEVDWNVNPESGSPVIGIVALNNGANNLQNSILLGIERQSGGINRVYCFVINSNVTQAEIYGSGITDGTYKIAFAYKANDFALYVNGTQIGTDTSGSVPALNEVFLGKRFGTDTYIQADGTKQAVLFDTRLTNSELATLTTI